jgi:CIC family chloride channel protein
MLLTLLVVKSAATAITLASRFGGGVFSPSLYLGAMTGGAFGIIAAWVFPDYASDHGLYAIVGMGAVSAAILGAPISSALIVFELTGGYGTVIALLLAISMASGLMQAVHGQSFFHWQLSLRGLFLHEGAHRNIVRMIKVGDFTSEADEADRAAFADGEGAATPLATTDTLEQALRAFDQAGDMRLPVVEADNRGHLVGWARYAAALDAYNRALIEAHEEEHR